MSPFAHHQEIWKNKDLELQTFIVGQGLSLLIFSSKKRRFEDKKGGDAAEAVAMVKDRSAQGQGDGDGEIVVNRESLEIQN